MPGGGGCAGSSPRTPPVAILVYGRCAIGYPRAGRPEPARREAAEAWPGFLTTFDWTYFLTVTFDTPLPAYRQETVVGGIYKTLGSVDVPAHLFLATEPHLSRSMHVHGLLELRPEEKGNPVAVKLMALWYWRTLFRVYGRSQVVPVRKVGGVSGYCAKYLTKTLSYHYIW